MKNRKYMQTMTPEDLGKVNGGYLYHNPGNTIDVIDDKTGNVLSSIKIGTDVWTRAQNVGDAQRMAANLNQSRAFISGEQLDQLRRTGSIA